MHAFEATAAECVLLNVSENEPWSSDVSGSWLCVHALCREPYLHFSLDCRTNLVDPASSHMLVSKIKPCMSQYKLLYGETANGSLKQL